MRASRNNVCFREFAARQLNCYIAYLVMEMNETADEWKEPADALEKGLGLPEGFLEGLRNEDDWSFIIKVHALMEASVSHLLVQHFGDERLGTIFDFLELSDKRRGKIAFVSALDLLAVECRRFLSKLSEIRNSLVHNIKNVGFDLSGYVRGLNKDQFEVFVNSCVSIDLNEIDFGKNNERRKEWIARNAKWFIYRFALITMTLIYLKGETAVLNRRLREEAVKKLSAFIESSESDDADGTT
jgi:hypothetical protein